MMVLPGRPVAHEEVTDRRYTLVDPKMRLGQIPRRVRREEARERIEVPVAVHRLVEGARKLDRVGGRGLLNHGRQYPAGDPGGRRIVANGWPELPRICPNPSEYGPSIRTVE